MSELRIGREHDMSGINDGTNSRYALSNVAVYPKNGCVVASDGHMVMRVPQRRHADAPQVEVPVDVNEKPFVVSKSNWKRLMTFVRSIKVRSDTRKFGKKRVAVGPRNPDIGLAEIKLMDSENRLELTTNDGGSKISMSVGCANLASPELSNGLRFPEALQVIEEAKSAEKQLNVLLTPVVMKKIFDYAEKHGENRHLTVVTILFSKNEHSFTFSFKTNDGRTIDGIGMTAV